MEKLNLNTHEAFTPEIIKKLSRNYITSLVDFLTQDVTKIAIITKLRIHEVIDMRCDLLNKFSKVESGSQIYNKRHENNYLITRIHGLDELIGGGLPFGCITEICGLAGSGKTQLCMTISLRVVSHVHTNVLYVDTKGDFSAVNLQSYLDKIGYTTQEMARMMQQVQVVRVWNMTQLVNLFQQLKRDIKGDNFKLIVVDSLACLMLQYPRDRYRHGLILLNKFVNIARYLSKEMSMAVICVNLLTRWVEHMQSEYEDPNLPKIHDPGKSKWIERRHRCMGKYWQHIPALVLELDARNKTTIVRVKKSAFGPSSSSCEIFLTNEGYR